MSVFTYAEIRIDTFLRKYAKRDFNLQKSRNEFRNDTITERPTYDSA